MQSSLFYAVDHLWSEALTLGAESDRKPLVAFVSKDEIGGMVAQTKCLEPRPVIEFNRDYALEHLSYVRAFAPAHEMAHVLVCLWGKRSEWDEPHGEPWQRNVRLLVDHDQAEDIVEEELKREER